MILFLLIQHAFDFKLLRLNHYLILILSKEISFDLKRSYEDQQSLVMNK